MAMTKNQANEGQYKWRFGAIAMGVALVSASAAWAAPSVKIGKAPLISPAQADAYYASSTTWTNSTLESGRAAELKDVDAITFAATGEYPRIPDRIFEFVRNSVATTWTYGLTKGARGVIIDRAGTSFDQAQLMVELLRSQAFVASYKIGTIQLTGAQFAAWSGITSAKAACELLSSGGIPAVINGSTLADCAYGSASVTQIQLGHAWVGVMIDGVEYVYDPAYKPHDFKAGRNVAADAGLSSGQVVNAASNGMESGADAGTQVPYVRQANVDALKTQLDGYAQGIQGAIQANIPAGAAEDLVGGAAIQPVTRPANGMWRQTSLPYPSTVSRTISTSNPADALLGNLPDRYRTKLQVQVLTDYPAGEAINKVLFADQIYGRRLQYEPTFNTETGSGVAGFLQLRDDFRPAVELQRYATGVGTAVSGHIVLTVDMPYAVGANGGVTGDYMDAVIDRKVNFALPHVIVHGWGKTDAALVDKIGASKDIVHPRTIPPVPCETCVPEYASTKGDARRQLLGASWLAQSSRAGDLNAAIAQSVYTHHYSVGVVTADTRMLTKIYNLGGTNTEPRRWLFDSFDRMDIDSGISLTSKTSNATDRRAALQAIAAAFEVLEGSVNAQVSDLPDASSASMRFDWGNKPPAGEDNPGGVSPGPRRFYAFDGANHVHATTLAKVEGQVSTTATGEHGAGEPIIGDGELQARRNQLGQAVTQYASAGFYVVASEDAFLGPGQRAGPYEQQGTNGFLFKHRNSLQRGGALVAKRFGADGDPLEIAHVTVGEDGSVKGGGGGAQVYHQAQYDPSRAADILKARFVDRSNAEGIDLSTGTLNYVSPASITEGVGSFPESLTAQLIWRGGQEQDERFGPLSHVQPQTPWTTNWNNSLNISGSGLEAMGRTDVRAMAGTVAAFVALQDVYKSTYSASREVTGALVAAWWAKQLAGNVVTVSVGADSRQFVRKFDKQWLAVGPGPYATLTQTGERQVIAINDCNSNTNYVTTRGWGNQGVSFKVTNANGDAQNFVSWSYQLTGAGSDYCAVQRGFRLANWTFPKGITVTLEYDNGTSFALPQLTRVSNNLGRQIVFVDSGLGGFHNGLTGEDLRSVTVQRPTSGTGQFYHTDPEGKVTRFDVALVGDRYQLQSVYGADNATIPESYFGYSDRGLVIGRADRLALSNGRGPMAAMIVDRYEARLIHPPELPATTLSYYALSFDAHRRLTGYLDEVGGFTKILRDGRGRITSYIYPELDQEQIFYDDRNNPTLLRKIAKPGSAEAATPIEIQATWHPTWNKIATLTDARGATTTFNYYASGNGAGEISSVVRPAVAGGSPTYQFTYNNRGQVLTTVDPTNVNTTYAYDATGYVRTKAVDSTGVWALSKFTNDVHGDPLVIDGPRTDIADTTLVKYDKRRRKVLEAGPNPGTGKRTATRTTYDNVGRVVSLENGFTGADLSGGDFPLPGDFTSVITTTMEYDLVGNKIRETTPAGITQFSYDTQDRLVCAAKRMNPQASLPADACALSAEGTYGPDQITKTVYDAASRVAQVITGVGKLNIPFATYEYSANGQRKALIDGANNRTTLVYDGFDRLKIQYFPHWGRGSGTHNANDREEYGYDPNGNRTSLRKRDSKVVSFTYDALNRVTAKTAPTEALQNVNYTYDLAGRMTSALYAMSGQGVTMTYDTAGRLDTETSYGWTVNIDHDKSGRRTRLTWPDGQAVEYLYDPAYQVKQIREPGATSGLGRLLQFSYDDLGRRTQIIRGNGGQATYGYDTAGRLQSLTQAGASGAPASIQTLAYTPGSQLLSLTQATPAYVWSGHPTMVKDYTYNGLNQDAAIAALSGGFDLNGNLTNSGTRTYVYDINNRLFDSTGGGRGTSITYDPLGRIRSIWTGGMGATTYFLHVGDQLIAEYAGTASNQPVLRRYVHGVGVDEPLVWYEGADTSQRKWLHADRQGSIIGVSDASGAVTPYTYGPYGEPNDWAGPRFRYTGQAALPELQAYYYKARIYDPALGRFLQTDPIGQADDPNLYAYVRSDPVNNQDPSGEVVQCGSARSDCNEISDLINKHSYKQYKFENGKLRVDSSAVNAGGSKRYSQMIDKGIESRVDIGVRFGATLTEPAKTKSGRAVLAVYKVSDFGEGVTSTDGRQIVVTGRPASLEGRGGGRITATPADILMHEFVEHAVPRAVEGYDRQGVHYENSVRRELRLPERSGTDHEGY